MALLRGVGLVLSLLCCCLELTDWTPQLPLESETDLSDPSPSMWEPIQQELSRMPPREILDFLVQYFVYELNW
jgi:hypothetical protein